MLSNFANFVSDKIFLWACTPLFLVPPMPPHLKKMLLLWIFTVNIQHPLLWLLCQLLGPPVPAPKQIIPGNLHFSSLSCSTTFTWCKNPVCMQIKSIGWLISQRKGKFQSQTMNLAFFFSNKTNIIHSNVFIPNVYIYRYIYISIYIY